MSNVEWLLREAADEQTLPVGQHNVIDDERWRATIERLQIGPGLRVFLTDAEARQDITIEARDDRTDSWMGTQTTLSGAADIDFLDGVKARATAEQMVMFRPSQRAAAYSLKAGTRFHSAGYGLDVERLHRLFDGAVPSVLQPLLAREVARTLTLTARGDRRMQYLAGNLFAHGLNGPLRTLMMEGAVIQLLAVQAAAVSEEPRPRHRSSLTTRERDALHEARRRLLADMRRPPTLGELAEAVGLSEKRLNAGFRLLFGATVFDVLRNERLAHAQAVLEAEAVPLREVARRVGYNHVSNFVSAFARRYGAPPRQYIDGKASRA